MSVRKITLTLTASALIIFTVFIHLNSKKKTKAAGSYFYTLSNGLWEANDVWSTTSSYSTTCNCYPGCNYNGPGIVITHQIVAGSCSKLVISGGGVCHVTGNGKLTVNSDFEVNGGSRLIISNGDSVIVSGKFTISGGSSVNVVGGAYFSVAGNVSLSGGSNVCGPGGNGTILYGGTLSGSGWNSCTSTLPIELISFKAEIVNEEIKLSWSTATETNNDYFTIERSTDGVDFETLQNVRGASNSSTTLYYSAIDPYPLSGTSFYRLKQTDFDGSFTYSPIEYIKFKGSSTDAQNLEITKVFPTVFSNHINVSFVLPKSGDVDIQILNNSGAIVYSDKMNAFSGQNQFETDLPDLPSGLYYLVISDTEKKVLKRIIKS